MYENGSCSCSGRFFVSRGGERINFFGGATLCNYDELLASRLGGARLSPLRNFALWAALPSQIQLLGAKTFGPTPSMEFMKLEAGGHQNTPLLSKLLFDLLTEDGIWQTLLRNKYLDQKVVSRAY